MRRTTPFVTNRACSYSVDVQLQSISSHRAVGASPPLSDVPKSRNAVTCTILQLHGQTCSYTDSRQLQIGPIDTCRLPDILGIARAADRLRQLDESCSKEGTVGATPYWARANGLVDVGVFPAVEIGDTQIPQIVSAMGHTSASSSRCV
jgi:hypothetical protein